MFTLEKKFTFESGHQLHHHGGKCSVPHGHSYTLYVTIQGESLAPSGPQKNMVMDFFEMKKVISPMIETYFDHKWLNDTLESDSPTAEYIAKWIYDYLKPRLPLLQKVTLFETATSSVSYEIAAK